jgi:hypothetical protein
LAWKIPWSALWGAQILSLGPRSARTPTAMNASISSGPALPVAVAKVGVSPESAVLRGKWRSAAAATGRGRVKRCSVSLAKRRGTLKWRSVSLAKRCGTLKRRSVSLAKRRGTLKRCFVSLAKRRGTLKWRFVSLAKRCGTLKRRSVSLAKRCGTLKRRSVSLAKRCVRGWRGGVFHAIPIFCALRPRGGPVGCEGMRRPGAKGIPVADGERVGRETSPVWRYLLLNLKPNTLL